MTDNSQAAHMITAAALMLQNGLVLSMKQPARHHDIMRAASDAGIPSEQICSAEQGFSSSHRPFVTRQQAVRIAREAGQLDKVRPKTGPASMLFSEDVW